MQDVAAWWLFVLRHEAKEFWHSLPGPWYVKVLLIVATQAIPGQLDDMALIALLAYLRKRKERKAQCLTS